MGALEIVLIVGCALVVAGVVGAAIWRKVTGKKGGCDCGCSGCPHAGACHTSRKNDNLH